MTVEECSPLYPPPCALDANRQMDSTSLTSVRPVSMNGSPLPGTGTAYACTPASGACVITSRIPCLAHRGRGRVFPAVLAPFRYKPLAPDVVVQQVDLQSARVDANMIDPPRMRKLGDGNCSVGYLGSAMCVFVSGVLWNGVRVVVVDVRLRELVKICMRKMTAVSSPGGLRRTQLGHTTRPVMHHVPPCGSLSWAGGPS